MYYHQPLFGCDVTFLRFFYSSLRSSLFYLNNLFVDMENYGQQNFRYTRGAIVPQSTCLVYLVPIALIQSSQWLSNGASWPADRQTDRRRDIQMPQMPLTDRHDLGQWHMARTEMERWRSASCLWPIVYSVFVKSARNDVGDAVLKWNWREMLTSYSTAAQY